MPETPPETPKVTRKTAPRKSAAPTGPAETSSTPAITGGENDSSSGATESTSPTGQAAELLKNAKGKILQQADTVKGQATNTARSAAVSGKEKAGSAMQSLSRMIDDSANTVDEKLGNQYGDYARYAAEAIAGAAKALDNKDIDDLVNEARDFVRKSPAVGNGRAEEGREGKEGGRTWSYRG